MENAGNGWWRKPHFFQPILPPFQQLSIPRAFLKNLVGEMSEEGEGEATLRNNRCAWKSWPVKINGFRFTDGWGDFVRDNGIRLGYFVVFRYDGAMVFNVTVFNRSSCEKDYSIYPPSPPIAIEKEAQMHDSQDTEEEVKANKSCASSSKSISDSFKALLRFHNLKSWSCVIIPKVFVRSNGLRGKIFKAILRDEKGRSWSVDLNECSDGRMLMGAGWHEFSIANRLKEGHTCLFKLKKSGQKIHEGGEDAIVLDVTVISSSSERRPLVKNNEGTEIKPSRHSNRFFLTSLKPFNLKESRLNIPMDFARSNGLMGKILEMALRDRDGRSWRMLLTHRKSRGTVSICGDWIDISGANVLKGGDTCVFELVRREKKPVIELRLL